MSAPVIIGFLKGDDYIIEMANEGLLEVWGRTNDIIGKPLLEAIPELEPQGFISLLEQVRITGEPFYAYEFPIALERNGKEEILYFDFIYKPFYENNTGSKADGIISVGHDVTEKVIAKKRVDEAKKEADSKERLYEAINDNTPDLIYVFGLDYTFTYANKALLNMWGKSWDEAIGKRLIENGYEQWHADMHEREIDQVVATKTSVRGAVSFPHATLGRRYYDYILVPVIGDDGNVEAVAGTTRDITEFKIAEQTIRESEAQLQKKVEERTRELQEQKNLFDNILKNSSNGITVTEMIRDKEGKIIDARTILANEAAVKYTGLPKEVFLSKTACELDPGIIESDYGKSCLKTLETGEPTLSQYYMDITSRWQELTISKMDDDHLIHIFTDITPIKEAQLQLERTIEELKHSNTNLEEFAYAASHDLKEPIRKIHLFSDRLKERLADKMEPADLDYFTRMELASKRMNTLIDDLLEYSYVSKGAVPDETVDLKEVVDIVLEDLDMEIAGRNATIEIAPLPVIKGHKRQIQQLMQNLITNALKYSRPDISPKVQIKASLINGNDESLNGRKLPTKAPYHLLEIKDNGIGFSPEDAERIFNVFTRLHGNAEYKGSGVGLSIVRKVVENHRGQIWAEAVPGEGAAFKLLLPAFSVQHS